MPYEGESGRPLIDSINLLFGTSGVFSMRANSDVHPLAQLSAMGQGLMHASLRNVFIGKLGTLAVHLGLPKSVGSIAKPHLSLLSTLGAATLAISFVLYYVLPMMPFIYFIFAIVSWIGGIFECIVAVPLWALAHIMRMDGPGLPGPAASNGYFLIFEIFIRPFLILSGMLASITIFSAMVKILNNIFGTLEQNFGGFDYKAAAALHTGPTSNPMEFVQNPVDQLFLTILYVIICYMIGLSCFKLIDVIPNTILRWMGSSVSTFEAAAGDPAGSLVQKAYKGGTILSGQAKGGALSALLSGKS
jgi:conjugal transfer/type IV secretion protein DotA/TraY